MKNQITIQTLVKTVIWEGVERSLKYYYPEDKSNYKKVFKYLNGVEKKIKNNKEEITLCVVPDMFEVCDAYHGMSTNKYSLSFRPWAEIANIPISKETIKHYKNEEIIAHFIWEITFYGNEKQMNKTAEDLKNRSKELTRKLKKK